jgi:medium-chain acyl-[acyl-carrier-protein] hydrolase
MQTVSVTSERIQSIWLANYRAWPDAAVRLFCFPYAGGSVAAFRGWQGDLPLSIESSPVQLPGRGARISEPPFESLHETVEALAHALSPFFDKPFAFFGHSMGALIALELSRRLRREKKALPLHLFVSGRRAPQCPDIEPPIHKLSDSDLIARLRRFNGTPHDALDHPELMQLMLPLLRADFSVCETYQYYEEPALDCPITVFGGIGDREVPAAALPPWREHTTAAFSLHMFPGDHFFLHTAQSDMLHLIARKLVLQK